MVLVRSCGEDVNVNAHKHNFSFFNEMQTSIMNIFKLLGTRFGCQCDNKLRTIYIETSKVIYTYFEKEINEGNYSFTAQEDQLFYNFYKMIGYTRSIKYGLGERDQTYTLIMAWWNYYPEYAYHAIKHMVKDSCFGFWGDIKHFCYFVDKYWNEFNTHHCGYYNNRENYFNLDNTHPLIKFAVELMAKQLQSDIRTLCIEESKGNTNNIIISNAAKWTPSEKSKSFGWIYKMLAIIYKKNIYANSSLQLSFSLMKRHDFNDIFGKFRKNIVSRLNKFIDPPQIKQCSNDWHEIDFSNVTHLTCKKYYNSFANLTYDKQRIRCPFNIHRIKCRENFMIHKEKMIQDKFDMFNGCHNVDIPINEHTTDYEMINLIVSKATTCIPDVNCFSLMYTITDNIKNKNFIDTFKKHWYRVEQYDNLKDVIPVIDLYANYNYDNNNCDMYPSIIILTIATRIIENMNYKKGCYLYFTNCGVTEWFDASQCEDVFDIVRELTEIYNKNIVYHKKQKNNHFEHAFSMETIVFKYEVIC
jgi:hypothetical protein